MRSKVKFWSDSAISSCVHGVAWHCAFPNARAVLFYCCAGLIAACATDPKATVAYTDLDVDEFVEEVAATSVLEPDAEFIGSPYEDIGLTGLFPVRSAAECEVAVLGGGEDSFAMRLKALKQATTSVRIQALIFNGDESGLRIAEVLKEKKAEGLDVRIIVDAFSNLGLQTQWLYFDLKQNGIEVEGYEALGLQWLNELPIPDLVPHADSKQPDQRFHEKMWIIDGETDHGIAITGGLNIGNEYFRVDPSHPESYWRDQDVAVNGEILGDLIAAFDRNFDYFVGIKEAKGIFNTNLYWKNTRKILDKTGKVPVNYTVDDGLVERVNALEFREPGLDFRPAICRFFQNRPRFAESYIQQAYIKLIERAQNEVLIANAYFVPTPSISAALKDAARRCVSIGLISNSPETNDLPEISMVGRGHYKDLLAVNGTPEVISCENEKAGMRIWEWVGKSPGEVEASQGTMHSKYAVVDERISLVGSYNLDPRSEKLNSESALVFQQKVLSAQLRETFLNSDLAYSEEVTAERAAEFADPDEVIYEFRESIGELFEEEL